MNTVTADVRPAKMTGGSKTSSYAAPTRRALISGAGLAALAATVATTGPAATSDIERHWQDRRQAHRELEADHLTLELDGHDQQYWDRIDVAEQAILASCDSSNRAIEIKLWTAWSHTDRDLEIAIYDGDVAAILPHVADLDWHEKMLFSAILALRGEVRS